MKKRLARPALIWLGMLVGLALLAAVAFRLIHRTNGNLVSAGEKRTYLLYVPGSYDPATPTPLVISIHGYAEWPAHQMQISHWNDLAEQYGFLVVYPSGTGFPMRWRTFSDPVVTSDASQDVVFISDLIDKLRAEYNLDPARIYANGLSNGGGMSFVLSCQLSERIAAIGSVSGAYLYPWETCQPSRPVPTILFHGTGDPIVPFEGGPSKSFDLPFPSIPEWVEALALRNGCGGEPLELPASGKVSGTQFTNCAADAEVVFYTIYDGGHSWPGGEPLPESIAGTTSQEIEATKTIWEFFVRHPLPGQ